MPSSFAGKADTEEGGGGRSRCYHFMRLFLPLNSSKSFMSRGGSSSSDCSFRGSSCRERGRDELQACLSVWSVQLHLSAKVLFHGKNSLYHY